MKNKTAVLFVFDNGENYIPHCAGSSKCGDTDKDEHKDENKNKYRIYQQDYQAPFCQAVIDHRFFHKLLLHNKIMVCKYVAPINNILTR